MKARIWVNKYKDNQGIERDLFSIYSKGKDKNEEKISTFLQVGFWNCEPLASSSDIRINDAFFAPLIYTEKSTGKEIETVKLIIKDYTIL